MRQTLELLRHPPQVIRISADSLTVVDDSGTVTTWQINGKDLKELLEGGGELKTSVRWKGDAIRVERKVNGGGKLVETYELGLGGRRLLAFIEVAGLMQPVSLTREYQPADSALSDSH